MISRSSRCRSCCILSPLNSHSKTLHCTREQYPFSNLENLRRWQALGVCHRQSPTSCSDNPSSPHHKHQILPAGTPPLAYQGHQLCQVHAFAYQPACRHHLHQNSAALHIANNRVQNWPSKDRLAASATGAKPMPHALPVFLCHRTPLCNICIKAPSHSPFLGAAPVTASSRP
jgi:hypothetical protein